MGKNLEERTEPRSILDEGMKVLIREKTGKSKEGINEADHPTGRKVSFEYLPVGYGGRLLPMGPYVGSSRNWPLNWIPIIYDEFKNKIEGQQFALWLKGNPSFRGRNDPKLSRVYEFFAYAYQRVKRIYH